MDDVILSRIIQEAYDQGYQDGKVDGYNLAGTRMSSAKRECEHGKWIMHIDDLFPVESTMECSKCHHEQSLIIDDNFCPNCGADMREETEDV